jgi:ribosomal-protein-alanine N-acetyltransferase
VAVLIGLPAVQWHVAENVRSECITFQHRDAAEMSADVADAMMPRVSEVPIIPTPRSELVSMSVAFMQALLARDLAAASTIIGAGVPDDLPDRLDGFLQFRIADLTEDPAAQPWLGRAIVLTDEAAPARRWIIGSVGFHAPPGPDGRVEVGYHVEPEYRRRGVATEAITALFDWAAVEHGVTRFRASVAPDNAASLAVVEHFGFRRTGVQLDDLDGEELVFDLDHWVVTA